MSIFGHNEQPSNFRVAKERKKNFVQKSAVEMSFAHIN